MALTSRISVSAQAAHTSPLDLTVPQDTLTLRKALALTDGTDAGEADLVFHDQRTLTASASEDLDLAGSLTDAFGAALTFARVKALVIVADSGNPETIEVGGAALNAWATWAGDATDVVIVRPGGLFALAATDATAYPVTADTADLLTLTNGGSGGSVTYDVVLIGTSA